MRVLAQRNLLIKRMKELESSGNDCRNCSGNCCTYEANSMLLTPIEALDIIEYLKTSGLYGPELKERLQKNISTYRLEPKFPNTRSYLRKTYTCPFFNHRELGCSLPQKVKPFGCLAFNSHHAELKASLHCYSEIDVLEKREKENPHEVDLNQKIREEFQLFWEKAPIPNALLDLWEKI